MASLVLTPGTPAHPICQHAHQTSYVFRLDNLLTWWESAPGSLGAPLPASILSDRNNPVRTGRARTGSQVLSVSVRVIRIVGLCRVVASANTVRSPSDGADKRAGQDAQVRVLSPWR